MATKKVTMKNIFNANIEPDVAQVALCGGFYNEITLNVKKNLLIEDAVGFVKNVVATCIDDERAEYMPESFDFAMRLYTLYYYAGVDLTKDVGKAYRVLYCTDIYDKVVDVIDETQYNTLIDAMTERIDHWLKMIEASVAGKIMEMVGKMDELAAGSYELANAVRSDDFKTAMENIKNYTDNGYFEEDHAGDVQAKNGDKNAEDNVVYLKKPEK